MSEERGSGRVRNHARKGGALLALCLSGALLGGCATGRLVDSASAVEDDGERNVVLLSYDVTLDTFDRQPGVDGTQLRLRCASGGPLFDSPTCFGIDVPYVGQQEREGTLWHAFAVEGAGLYRMEYGGYRLDSASFSVLIDQGPETRCYEDRRGRTRCTRERATSRSASPRGCPSLSRSSSRRVRDATWGT